MFHAKNGRHKLPLKKVNLTFFFLIASLEILFLTRPVFAATPTVPSISPSSGSIAPDVSKIFTCAYRDNDGWADLKEAYLLIGTSSTALADSVYLYYDQNVNLLYLRDDVNASWLGGFAPGSNNVVENSQVKLNCSLTTVSGSFVTLTVKYDITFKAAYSGKIYDTYLKAVDDTGGYADWTKRGTFAVTYAPVNGTITPSSGTGPAEAPQIFIADYADADGWENIQSVYLLMNTSVFYYPNCLYAYYDQNTGKLYLRNDADTAWLGGYAPGSSNLIENTYAKLDCSQTTVSGSGTALTVNWSVILRPPFTGPKNTYLMVKDDLNVSPGFELKGTWTIPNNPPLAGAISPSSGSLQPAQTVNITTAYTDPDTWPNIQYAYLLINDSTTGANCFYAYYDQNSDKLYLRSDSDSAWLGGYAPGSADSIENSSAKLYCLQTTVSGAGNTLTVNWNVSFKPAFTGVKNAYLYVKDDANAYQDWTQKGDLCIFRDPVSPP